MITALVLVCSMNEPYDCTTASKNQFYPTEEACYADRPSSDAYFNQLQFQVMGYQCINWGESA